MAGKYGEGISGWSGGKGWYLGEILLCPIMGQCPKSLHFYLSILLWQPQDLKEGIEFAPYILVAMFFSKKAIE